VNWTSSNNLLFENGAVIGNSGLFDVKTDADLQHTTGCDARRSANTGTLRKSAGTGDTGAGGEQSVQRQQRSDRRHRSANGTLTVPRSMTNSGIIDVSAGSVFSTGGNALTNAAGGIVRGRGSVNVGAAALTNNGTIEPAGANAIGTLTVAGNLTQGRDRQGSTSRSQAPGPDNPTCW
jgi:hypothetical protein